MLCQRRHASLLLEQFAGLFCQSSPGVPGGRILDVACGTGLNGLFLAEQGADVLLCDRNADALATVRRTAADRNVQVRTWCIDLERDLPLCGCPLAPESFAGILVFRYLHRPLLPCLASALAPGGVLIYETFLMEQRRFGKPANPDFLLHPGELLRSFSGFEVLHTFEGLLTEPQRAVAQLVCRKPPKEDA